MNRCELANQYHERGFNCAQSVLVAFGDLTQLTEQQALAVSGAFGGGFGGTHQEACGAMSGAVMVLSLLHPHIQEQDPQTKRRLYQATKEFRRRFEEQFGYTRCGELLSAKIDPETQVAAVRLGITKHCAVLIVTAVEILEQMIQEMKGEHGNGVD